MAVGSLAPQWTSKRAHPKPKGSPLLCAAMARKRKRVPEVLWRLFGNRARALADTILALIPPAAANAAGCCCKQQRCLYCSGDEAMSFLVRPDDPSDYRRLLTRCFVVVSDDAPPVPALYPHHRWSQLEIVKRSIEMIRAKLPSSSNVICCSIDENSLSRVVLDELASSKWISLLQRVGDALMIYLLMYTSLFLPLPENKYHQISGFPISNMRFNPSVPRHHQLASGSRKRRRVQGVEPIHGRQLCIYSLGSETHSKSSRYLTSTESMNVSNEEISQIKCDQNSEQKSLSTKKHTRQYRWQRQRKRQHFELTTLPPCIGNCSNSDNLSTALRTDICTSSSPSDKKNSSHCLCCSAFQTIPRIKKNAEIDSRNIFYKSESYTGMLPNKHILYTLRPNNSGAYNLFKDIFGTFGINDRLAAEACFHTNNNQPALPPCLFHNLIKLLKKLIRNARNCPYKKLLDKHCSEGSSNQDTERGSGTEHKECISGTSLPLRRPEATHAGRKCFDGGIENNIMMNNCVKQPELRNFCCRKKQVVSFIWAISRRIIPSTLLGEISNWRILRKNISKFVMLRKFEKFSLKECTHKFKISKFTLLSDMRQCTELGNSDITRHTIMERWIFWFFSCLVSPLIQANFYVTDNEDAKLEVLYYRKSIWEKLIGGAECMKDDRYCRLNQADARKIFLNRMFGFSRARLLPKKVGFRMLANLRAPSRLPVNRCLRICSRQKSLRKTFNSRQVKFQYFKPVNKVLHDIHVVLKGLSKREPHQLDTSVFNYNGVYRKLLPFLFLLKKVSAISPSVFVVVSDVSRAFDSVKHDKLLSIMKDVIVDDEYVLEELTQVICSKKYLKVGQQQILAHQGAITDSGKIQLGPPEKLDGILVKKAVCRKIGKDEIFFNFKEHVTRNVVQFGRNFYLQRVGIPQGSVLSPLLCSLYYEHMERNVLFPFMRKASEDSLWECNIHDTSTSDGNLTKETFSGGSKFLLLRFLDDFLFVSNSKKQASMFFSRLERGIRDYNCFMNEEKCGLNFDLKDREACQSNKLLVGKDGISFLRWSGLLVNCSTLEIQADYTRYLSTHLSSTLTVSCKGRVGRQLTRKLHAFLRPKCHPIFYDSNINSSSVIRLNIYQVFLLCAMKFICYLSHLSILPKFSPQFCMNAFANSFRYMDRLIRKKMHSFETGIDVRPKYNMKKKDVIWLGLYAYTRVVKKKQSRYSELFRFLKSRLKVYGKLEDMPAELRYAVDDSHSSVLWSIKY